MSLATTQFDAPPAPHNSWDLLVLWAAFIPFYCYVAGGYVVFVNDRDFVNTITEHVSQGKYIEVFTRSAIVCAVALYVIRRRLTSVKRIATDAHFILLLSFLSITSVVWSVQPVQSIFAVMLLPELAIAYGLVATFTLHDLAKPFVLYTAIIVAACLALVVFFPDWGLQQSADWDAQGGSAAAWRGIFHQKNIAAENLLMLLPCVLYFKPRKYSLQWLMRCALIAAMLMLVVMSQSRLGWAAAIAYLNLHGFLSAVRKYKRQDRLVMLVAGASVATGTVALAIAGMSSLLSSIGKDASLTGRTAIWSGAISAICKRPLLGYGYKAFWRTNGTGEIANLIAQQKWGIPSAHNGLLEVAIGMGLVGGILLLAAFASSFANIFRSLRRGCNAEEQLCIELILVALLAGLTETPWNSETSIVWFLYILGDAYLREHLKCCRKQYALQIDRAPFETQSAGEGIRMPLSNWENESI